MNHSSGDSSGTDFPIQNPLNFTSLNKKSSFFTIQQKKKLAHSQSAVGGSCKNICTEASHFKKLHQNKGIEKEDDFFKCTIDTNVQDEEEQEEDDDNFLEEEDDEMF